MARDCKNPPPSLGVRGCPLVALPSRPLARLGALLLVFWILPLLKLRVELFSLSYSLQVPVSLFLGAGFYYGYER